MLLIYIGFILALTYGYGGKYKVVS